MNWVDLAIILILFFFSLEGLGKPFIFEVVDLISFLLAFSFSLEFFNYPAQFLERQFNLPRSFADVLGFIILWYLIEGVLFLILRLTLYKKSYLLRFKGDGVLSMIPSFFRGMVFVAILLILLGTFPIQPQIKKDISQSTLGSWILNKSYQIEGPIKQVFGDLAKADINFVTVEPEGNQSVNLGFKTDKFYFDQNLETQMINLVNQERTSRGLSALTYEPKLQTVARGHSADMLKRGYFSHYSPEGKTVADRAEAEGVDFLVIGENLAYAPSLETAHQGLMNSPGHRANILSTDYHKIGIGIANAYEYGLMFTQVFTD